MDIVQRNLFKLLRSGIFNRHELVEPMSAFKWGRLYQLAVMHDVVAHAYQGILRCQDQFFMRLTDQQLQEWQKAINGHQSQSTSSEDDDDLLRPDHLTNPLLNRKLQDILDDEHSNTDTRQVLLITIRIVRHLLNEGMPIRQLAELGIYMQEHANRIDYTTLLAWIDSLKLTQMTQLIGECMVLLYGFEEHEIPFLKERKGKPVERIAQELIDFSDTRSENWYFSQEEGSIFVHNSNSSAMFSHVRRSARYFRYYPSESLTNFFASFVHSLSHIEE